MNPSSVVASGSSSRDEVLARIAEVDFGDYELSNFRVTQMADTLVVTHLGAIEVDGVTPPLSWRINVCQWSGDPWLGIAFGDATRGPVDSTRHPSPPPTSEKPPS